MGSRPRDPTGQAEPDVEADTSAPASRRRPRLTPLPAPGKLKAVVLSPPSADLDALRAWLGAGWKVIVTGDRAAVEDAIDPRTHLVLLDDRCGASLLPLAKAAAQRAPSARIVLSIGAESIGEILAAGLERVAVGFLFRPLTAAGLDSELRGLFAHGPRAQDRQDRREFPRAELEEAVVLGPPGVDLRNISPNGALLVCPSGWDVGTRHALDLRLATTAPVQRVIAEVLHAGEAPLGRFAVAVRFVDPSTRFQDLVRASILEHLTRRDLRALSRRVRDEAAEREPLERPERIASVLQQLQEEGRPCTVSAPKGGRTWRSSVAALDEPGRRIELEWPHSARRVRPDDRLELFAHGASSSYLFEVRVLEQHARRVWCSWPDVIYHSEKRTHHRRPLPRGAPALVEIDAPPPWGRRRWPIHDVSGTGLSFLVPAGEALMLPGTPLRGLRLLVGGHPVAEYAAEIRHVVPREDGTVKVGVGLVPGPRAKTASRSSRRAQPDEAIDLAAPPGWHRAPPGARRVRFLNSRNEVVAGLLNTSVAGDARVAGPVVVVAPSFGKTKECFSTLAEWLCHRFGRQGQPIAVLRFDFTHSNGESHVPERNRLPGRECLDFTLSSALDDLHAAVKFVHATPLLEPTSIVLVGYSVSAPIALRAAAEDAGVSQVVSIMGAASLQETVRNVTGGLDYVADHLRGHRHGVVNFLGFLVDMDEICRDALASGFATARDTARDVASLRPEVEVGWVVGEHDGWVDRRAIERALEGKRGAPPEIVVLPTGHVPTQSEEAATVAEETTRFVWSAVHGGELPPSAGPTPEMLERVARDEWANAPRASIADRRAYWAHYLLGEGSGELGFDVLEWVPEYRDFMAQQVRLLAPQPGQIVLDAGGGTGNFLSALLASGLPLPTRIEIADLVPEALARAEAKTRAAVARAGLSVSFEVKSLEVSRLRPIERFVRGEVHGPEWLRGRIEGLDDHTLDHILALYGPAMHEALRGGRIQERLALALSEEERHAVEELGRAARLVLGELRPGDLRTGVEPTTEPLRTSHLRFASLVFGEAAVDEPLAFRSDGYDAIVASLMLPYLMNPDETVRELYRALRPGGRLVASSNRPNTDMSLMFTRLADAVASGRAAPPAGMDRERFLEQIRAYSNSAAFLLRLEEEHTFRFLDADRLRAMLEQAGFESVTVHPGFGDPPQAYVAVGHKPARRPGLHP
jgi:ubiquinone/menaquinone biosynthesis C-methylase UbiE/dienelactone hydrolase